MADENGKKIISILDVEFEVSMPYAAGMTINEAEAKVLNQTRRENLGNNFRARVKDHLEKGTPTLDELIAAFALADKEYVFTLSNAGASVKLTPEEREARKIAREYIKSELDKVGRKLSEVPEGFTEETWDDQVEAEVERIAATDEVKKMAKDIVKARSKTAGLSLGSVNLGGGAAA